MNKVQYKRKIQVVIKNREWTNDKLDIDFSRPFTIYDEEPELSEVIIYNLSPNSIKYIKKGMPLSLNAGYEGSMGNIIKGIIEGVETTRDETDKETTIKVSDYGVKWRESTLTKTYQAGSRASFIIQDLIIFMGMTVGGIDLKKDIRYPRGTSVKGDIKTSLKRIVKDTGSKMYINKGRVYVGLSNKNTNRMYVLEASSGLLRTPERIIEEETKEGSDTPIEKTYWNVECLLHHELDKGHIVQIKSKSINGKYRIVEGTHKGDFVTELKVEAV